MNLLIEFIKISKNLTAKSEAKAKREGNRRRFKNMWHRVRRSPIYCDLHAQILSVSLPQFSRLFCLLSSKILQNSLLELYLVDIRRYKLSLFAKPAHKNSPRLAIKFKIFESSVCDGQQSTGAGTRQVIGQIWEQSEVTQFFAKYLWSPFLKPRFRRPRKPIKPHFKLLSTKTLSFSSIQHCTSQLQTNYCFKTKRATAQCCMQCKKL